MALTTLTFLESATITPSGGTALVFSSQGIQGDKHKFVCDDDTDLRTQRSMEYTVKRPKPQASAPNGYTQARSSGIYKQPVILDNGEITVNTVTMGLNVDVEMTIAEKTELLKQGAQMFIDAELASLHTKQNLS